MYSLQFLENKIITIAEKLKHLCPTCSVPVCTNTYRHVNIYVTIYSR